MVGTSTAQQQGCMRLGQGEQVVGWLGQAPLSPLLLQRTAWICDMEEMTHGGENRSHRTEDLLCDLLWASACPGPPLTRSGSSSSVLVSSRSLAVSLSSSPAQACWLPPSQVGASAAGSITTHECRKKRGRRPPSRPSLLRTGSRGHLLCKGG